MAEGREGEGDPSTSAARTGQADSGSTQGSKLSWKQLMTPAAELYNRAFPKGKNADEVPTSAVPTLAAIAASIKRSAAGMGQWGMAELTLGLYKVANSHALEGAVDTITGSPVTARHELMELLHWLRWAMAAYEFDKAMLAKNLGVREDCVLKHVTKSAVMQPAYYIAVDDERECVVLGIRGTHAASDVLTDLTPHSELFEGGYAHSGMLGAARWLLAEEGNALKKALVDNKNYSLVLTGHSLGAGTAALLAMLLREAQNTAMPADSQTLSRLDVPPSRVSCWVYACPPCVDSRLAASSTFISTIVLQDDVVARCSPASLDELRTEILETDWSVALEEGSMQRRMVELAQQSHSYMTKFEAAAGLPPGHLYTQAKKLGWSAVQSAGQKMVQQLGAAQNGGTAAASKSSINWFSAAGILAGAVVSVAAQQAANSIAEAERSGPFTNHRRGQSGHDATDAEVAATALAANVAKEQGAALTAQEAQEHRLFAPGILYHIVRQPLEGEAEPPVSVEELVKLEGQTLAGKGGNGDMAETGEGRPRKTEVEYWIEEEKTLEAEGVNISGDKSANASGAGLWWWDKLKQDMSKDKVDGNQSDQDERGEGNANKLLSVVQDLQSKVFGSQEGNAERRIGESYKERDHDRLHSKEALPCQENPEQRDLSGDRGKKLWVNYPTIFGSGSDGNSSSGKQPEGGKAQGKEREGWGGKSSRRFKKGERMTVRHVVVKATDSNSRFRRIVLSGTMLSDHACKPYGDGLINAIQWS